MDTLKYYVFCQLLDNIRLSKLSGKRKISLIFTQKFREYQKECKVYPFIRLLLPHIDNKRTSYGVAKKSLAKLLVKTLAWDHRIDPTAKRIYTLNYQIPPQSEKFKLLSDELLKSTSSFQSRIYFGDIIEDSLLVKGFDIPPNKKMTLNDINLFLDEFQLCKTEAQQRTLLFKMITKMNANQIAWLLKIISKELKLGMSHELILKGFHPSALDFYNKNSDLHLLCMKLVDIDITFNANINLFKPFKPMLAEKESLRKIFEANINILVEEKYDGERIIFHYSKVNSQLKIYTRNMVDYTDLYAPQFVSILSDIFPEQIENIILDGEMLAYSSKIQNCLPFGNTKTVAKLVKDSLQKGKSFKSEGSWLCYKIFDILLVNDRITSDLSQIERKQLLNKYLRSIKSVVDIVPYTVISKDNQIQRKLFQLKDEFKTILSSNKEGLILKYDNSPYVFKRSNVWFKIKKDFYTKLRDEFDVIILGFTMDLGRMASLMIGVRNDSNSLKVKSSKDDPFVGHSMNDEYLALGEVSAGLKFSSYQIIEDKLQAVRQEFDKNCPPTFLQSFKTSSSAKCPDFFISPSESVIITVTASEILENDNHYAKFTFRFPRITNINREDKGLDEISTFSDVFKSFNLSKDKDIKFLGEEEDNIGKMRLADFRMKKNVRKSKKRKLFLDPSRKED